jgi:lactoylglutathione lyase
MSEYTSPTPVEGFLDPDDPILFPRLTAAQIGKLAESAETISLSPGEIVLKQGQRNAPLYVVLSGAIDVIDRQPEGDRYFTQCQPGTFLAFYTGLGYQKLGEVPETSFGSLTMLKLPSDEFVTLELVHEPTGGHVDPSGLNHLVIQVEALHDTVARLTAQGIDAEPPSSPDGSDHFWTCWLTDPDGYRIELVEWPPGHPDGMTAADFS